MRYTRGGGLIAQCAGAGREAEVSNELRAIRSRGWWIGLTIMVIALHRCAAIAPAGIPESAVLVVHNSAFAEGTALKNQYMNAHPGIPALNVCDLNNASMPAADLTYAQFISLVRNPIRSYLQTPGGGRPTPRSIVAIVLIRPMPHRIWDIDADLVGDFPQMLVNELLAGDATCASVDSELSLLWQDLSAGEAGGVLDSYADNTIVNPYFMATQPINAFTRDNIQSPKLFANGYGANIVWFNTGSPPARLTEGDIYLVNRIDGHTLADAGSVISRASNLVINKATCRLLLDESAVEDQFDDDSVFDPPEADPYWGGADYELTRDAFVANGWSVRHDAGTNFISGSEESNPLILYASYGENHRFGGEDPPGDGTYIESGFVFVRGAIFNSLESYNGRALNGLDTRFLQEQCADFISVGGTFAFGNVWEPLSQFVADNLFVSRNFLINGMTFGEAAWSALPAVSWQQIVIGDPLATAIIVNDLGGPRGDLNGDGRVDGDDIPAFTLLAADGIAAYHAQYPLLDPIARGDFNGDGLVSAGDAPAFATLLLAM